MLALHIKAAAECPAGSQDPKNLPISGLLVRKSVKAVQRQNDVEGVVCIGECSHISLPEGYIFQVQAVSQVEAGAQVLDVNVGAPGVDEPALMPKVVKALQSVTSLPLQLDSSNVQALENGLRVYNGKPIVNSTNGEQEKLDAILPLCKK